MTIARHLTHFRLICDACGLVAAPPQEFAPDQFADLQAWLAREGWKKQRVAAEWHHRCPICAKFSEGRLL